MNAANTYALYAFLRKSFKKKNQTDIKNDNYTGQFLQNHNIANYVQIKRTAPQMEKGNKHYCFKAV